MAVEDAERMKQAIARLSPEQQRLVAACLDAIASGPYIEDDDEFHTVMGVTRDQATAVSASWPESAPGGDSFLTVNNALNNLLGYPHGQWRGLSRSIDAGKREVARALMVWRDEDRREAGGQGYWDGLM